MLILVMKWLAAQWALALTVTVSKGYPTWGRLAAVPPLGALELSDLQPRGNKRIGEQPKMRQITANLWIFAGDEPDLWRLLGLATTWLEANPNVVLGADEHGAGGTRAGLTLIESHRYQSQTGAEQEQYGWQFSVSVAW